MRLEQAILKHLIYDEDYLRKVLPFLKSEYFTDLTERTLFNEITSFTTDYNNTPTIEALAIAVKERRNLTDDEVQKCQDYLKEIEGTSKEKAEIQWLVDKSEKFCQEKAIYNAVLGSISILDGKDKTHDKGAIPKILSDALAVSFDNSVGHDYLENSDERYEFYHKKEERIPFDLDLFNKITKGGLPKKTLNIALAGTGVGKSLFMCHAAAGCMVQGKNVLYIALWNEFGFDSEPASKLTDATAHKVMFRQDPDGKWDFRIYRPPSEYSHISATAMELTSLRAYHTPGRAAEVKERIARGGAWVARGLWGSGGSALAEARLHAGPLAVDLVRGFQFIQAGTRVHPRDPLLLLQPFPPCLGRIRQLDSLFREGTRVQIQIIVHGAEERLVLWLQFVLVPQMGAQVLE